jgi:hypothetical protein
MGDIREDEKDHAAGRTGGTPRAIEGPLYVAGAPLARCETRVDDGEPHGDVMVMEGRVALRRPWPSLQPTGAHPLLRRRAGPAPADHAGQHPGRYVHRRRLRVRHARRPGAELRPDTPPAGYESPGVTQPFTLVQFDFVLQKARDENESKPMARIARATA